MDFVKLNPWNWFTKEAEHSDAVPVSRTAPSESNASRHGSLQQLHTELDRFIADTFRSVGVSSSLLTPLGRNFPLTMPDFKPKIDIAGSEKEYTIMADLPGVEEKDIEIELKGNDLILSAHTSKEEKTEEKGYYRMERSSGSCQRVLHLPADADKDAIKATHKNGVLTITLPRKKQCVSDCKRIEIESQK